MGPLLGVSLELTRLFLPIIKQKQKEKKIEVFLCFFTQEVSDAALEKRLQLETHDLGPKFESLKQEYGQTPSHKSLYNLFESFKETALNPVR